MSAATPCCRHAIQCVRLTTLLLFANSACGPAGDETLSVAGAPSETQLDDGSIGSGVPLRHPATEVSEDTSPAGLLVEAARAGDVHCVRELLAGGVAPDSESGGTVRYPRCRCQRLRRRAALPGGGRGAPRGAGPDREHGSDQRRSLWRRRSDNTPASCRCRPERPCGTEQPDAAAGHPVGLDEGPFGPGSEVRPEGRGAVQGSVGAHPGRGRSAPRSRGSPAADHAREGHRRRNRAAVRQRPGITCPPPLRRIRCAPEPFSSPRSRSCASWWCSRPSGLR